MVKSKKGGWIYITFFGAVMALFIGILVYVYHESKLANPVILDEKGRPR
jgi:hypothetical protein